jgi:hypothetical protein
MKNKEITHIIQNIENYSSQELHQFSFIDNSMLLSAILQQKKCGKNTMLSVLKRYKNQKYGFMTCFNAFSALKKIVTDDEYQQIKDTHYQQYD